MTTAFLILFCWRLRKRTSAVKMIIGAMKRNTKIIAKAPFPVFGFLPDGFAWLSTGLRGSKDKLFDASVVFIALPTIVVDLQCGQTYIWIINAYTIAMCAVQPLCG